MRIPTLKNDGEEREREREGEREREREREGGRERGRGVMRFAPVVPVSLSAGIGLPALLS